MGNASTDEHQTARNNISADDATSNAGKQTSQQSVSEKGEFEQFEHFVLYILMYSPSFSDDEEEFVFQFIG